MRMRELCGALVLCTTFVCAMNLKKENCITEIQASHVSLGDEVRKNHRAMAAVSVDILWARTYGGLSYPYFADTLFLFAQNSNINTVGMYCFNTLEQKITHALLRTVYVNLNNNYLTKTHFPLFFKHMPNLRELWLANNKIRAITQEDKDAIPKNASCYVVLSVNPLKEIVKGLHEDRPNMTFVMDATTPCDNKDLSRH